MVKGVTRRVVVVRPPEGEASFEQAIFFLRDEAPHQRDALREACAVAETYLRTAPRRAMGRWFTRGQLLLSFCAGAGLTGVAWLAVALLF